MFEGFTHTQIATDGATINLRYGGSGSPVLLMHGYPQTHMMWHLVAPRLAAYFRLVVPDLRGYGDSSLPEPGAKGGAGRAARTGTRATGKKSQTPQPPPPEPSGP